jgi:hypothetical protein
MLTLRHDWQSMTSGGVAASLVAQARTRRVHNEIACHMVSASLDLLVNTWPRKNQPPLRLETVAQSIWRISGLYYIYLRMNDDKTLAVCMKLSRSETTTVILPRRYERLKRRLLTAALGGRTPGIWSLDSFISYRTLFATADQAWPHRRATFELLKAYNHRVNTDSRDGTLLVPIPQEPSWTDQEA